MQTTVPQQCFGNGQKNIYFLHANGYPPAAYQLLFNNLPNYTFHSMLLKPHWQEPSSHDIKNWDPFVDDLEQFIKQQDSVDYVVGHSIGATLWLLASLRGLCKPKKIVLIDPAVFSSGLYYAYSFMYILGLHKRFHPYIQKTLKRKTVFNSFDIIFKQYRQKNI